MRTASTTIRVSVATRERLMDVRDRDFADASVDTVVNQLLDEHADLALRRRVRADTGDLAEVRQLLRAAVGLL